MQHLYPS